VSWQAPADGASPITGYTAVASPGGASCTADAPATSCRITGLKDGSAYTFTVTATNAFGTSPASEPTAPVTLSYPAGGDNVSVSVSAKAQCVNGAPSLAVYVANKEPVKVDARITTDLGEVKVSGLTPGAAKYVTFPGTGRDLASGSGKVATYTYVDGTAHYTVHEIAYQGVTCG